VCRVEVIGNLLADVLEIILARLEIAMLREMCLLLQLHQLQYLLLVDFWDIVNGLLYTIAMQQEILLAAVYAAGFIGDNYMTDIYNCYSTGASTSATYTGGFCGDNEGGNSYTCCY
jgi:hypothetical protein